MSSVSDPTEKKRLSLARDHRTLPLEGNKSFRSAWRRKKAKANRKARHAMASELAAKATDESQDLQQSQLKRTLEKFGVMSLAQTILTKGELTSKRWNLSYLALNPDARDATTRLSRVRSKRAR